MGRYDDIEEVKKTDQTEEIVEVEKFNPFHDSIGRFSSSHGMRTYSANPKTKAGQMAINRSTNGGHGNVMNIHRESKGETIGQNYTWIMTGQKPAHLTGASQTTTAPTKPTTAATKPTTAPKQQTKPTVNNTQNGSLEDAVANVKLTSTQKLALQARDWNGNPTNTHVRAVDHDQARVDGKDISKTFKVDNSSGAKDPIDQVAEAQGWKKAPTVTNDKELFDKAAVQAGRVMLRSVHNDPGMTADQVCTKTMSDANSPLGGSGGKCYGSGMYVVDTHIKGKSNPARDIAAGQDESYGYGDRQMMMTVHPSARIATPSQGNQLINEFYNLSSKDKARFGNDANTYIASKGYDGVKWHRDSDPAAYTTIFNQSALIFYGGVSNRY